MNWFQTLCRNIGLMVHNVRSPDHERKVVRKDIEEKKHGNVTLRRTTIEIEFHGDSSTKQNRATNDE